MTSAEPETTDTHPAREYAPLATVQRSGFVESVHFGSLVTLGADGSVAATVGRPGDIILPRSTVKPIQAAVCLAAGAPLAGASLAVAAASHCGQDEHVAEVRGILRRAGLTEDDLQCPPDEPSHGPTRRRLIASGDGPTRIRMNCSGKHAAMLAACVASGWSTKDYRDPGHPLQRLIAEELSARAGEPISHVAVDGCGAPLYGLSLVGLARALRSVVTDPPGSAGRAVADAMRAYPFQVAGTGHVNTVVMQKLPGTLCKGGAEGVIVAVAESGATVAVKVIDGGARATTAIALTALASLGVDIDAARDLTAIPVLGGGQPVGDIRASDAVARL